MPFQMQVKKLYIALIKLLRNLNTNRTKLLISNLKFCFLGPSINFYNVRKTRYVQTVFEQYVKSYWKQVRSDNLSVCFRSSHFVDGNIIGSHRRTWQKKLTLNNSKV